MPDEESPTQLHKAIDEVQKSLRATWPQGRSKGSFKGPVRDQSLWFAKLTHCKPLFSSLFVLALMGRKTSASQDTMRTSPKTGSERAMQIYAQRLPTRS